MLKWLCGKTRNDKIKNEQFGKHLGVSSIGDKIRKTHLRWFRHVPTQVDNGNGKKKFGYTSWWPINGNE